MLINDILKENNGKSLTEIAREVIKSCEENNCMKALNAFVYDQHCLRHETFRGKNWEYMVGTKKITPREKSSDTPLYIHNYFGLLSKEKFGINVRSETLFCYWMPMGKKIGSNAENLILPQDDATFFISGGKHEDTKGDFYVRFVEHLRTLSDEGFGPIPLRLNTYRNIKEFKNTATFDEILKNLINDSPEDEKSITEIISSVKKFVEKEVNDVEKIDTISNLMGNKPYTEIMVNTGNVVYINKAELEYHDDFDGWDNFFDIMKEIMTEKQHIQENNDENYNVLQDLIKTCRENNTIKYLKKFIYDDILILHYSVGLKKQIKGSFGTLTIKKREKPTDTPMFYHEFYNSKLKAKYNTEFRSLLFTYVTDYSTSENLVPAPKMINNMILPQDDSTFGYFDDGVTTDYDFYERITKYIDDAVSETAKSIENYMKKNYLNTSAMSEIKADILKAVEEAQVPEVYGANYSLDEEETRKIVSKFQYGIDHVKNKIEEEIEHFHVTDDIGKDFLDKTIEVMVNSNKVTVINMENLYMQLIESYDIPKGKLSLSETLKMALEQEGIKL